MATKMNHEKQKIYKERDNINNNMNPGDPRGSPDESSLSRNTIVFIDEAFLSKLSKYFGNGKYLKFDRTFFAKNIAKKQKLECEHVFLYIAPPFQDLVPSKEEEKKKEGYDKFVYKLKGKGIGERKGRGQSLKING